MPYAHRLIVMLFSLLIYGQPNAAPATLHDTLSLVGSLALADLTSRWAQDFQQFHPLIDIDVGDSGGGAGINELNNGSADVVLLGDYLPAAQIQALRDKYGYPPILIPVAMDAVAIYVNDGNPLRRITLAQLDGIFSATYLCGDTPIDGWQQLGISSGRDPASLEIYGLNDSTSAYMLFKRVALCNGDFRSDLQTEAGPDALELAISNRPGAIGFSSSAMHSTGIRALAVARQRSTAAMAPDPGAIRDGSYPLGRTLYIAVNSPPGTALPQALLAFIDYILSPAGQEVARKAGYVPLAPLP